MMWERRLTMRLREAIPRSEPISPGGMTSRRRSSIRSPLTITTYRWNRSTRSLPRYQIRFPGRDRVLVEKRWSAISRNSRISRLWRSPFRVSRPPMRSRLDVRSGFSSTHRRWVTRMPSSSAGISPRRSRILCSTPVRSR